MDCKDLIDRGQSHMEEDEVEYLLEGMLSKTSSKLVRRNAALEFSKACENPAMRRTLRNSFDMEMMRTVFRSIGVLLEGSSGFSAAEKEIREDLDLVWYGCLCAVRLCLEQENIEALGTSVPRKFLLALVKGLTRTRASKGKGETEDDIKALVCQSRESLERMFAEAKEEENGFKLQWIAKLDTSDLAWMALVHGTRSEMMGGMEQQNDKGGVAKIRKILSIECPHIVERIEEIMADWMEAGNPDCDLLVLWRLGLGLRLICNIVCDSQENKALVANRTKHLFGEILNISKSCCDWIVAKPGHEFSETTIQCLVSTLRVLTDLTDNCEVSCEAMTDHLDLAMDLLLLHGKTVVENIAEETWKFDAVVMVLGLLTNCVETNAKNRKKFASLKRGNAIAEIVNIFLATMPSDVVEAIRKAGPSAAEVEFGWTPEQLIVSAHTSILIACLLRDSRENKKMIMKLLPGHSSIPLIHVLRAFLAFQTDAQVLTSQVLVATSRIITELEGTLAVENKAVSPTPASVVPGQSSSAQHVSTKAKSASSSASTSGSKKRAILPTINERNETLVDGENKDKSSSGTMERRKMRKKSKRRTPVVSLDDIL